MRTNEPDLFTNVHKGLRRALFAACTALGSAGDDAGRGAAARSLLGEVLRFVAHHGDNEDALLVPLLEAHAPAVAARMRAAHRDVEAALAALTARAGDAPAAALYHAACDFTALYLGHMREEELELEPAIRASLPAEALAGFGRASVARTAPADQRMMLGWMLPAMTPADVEAFLGRLPPAVADALRPLAGAA